MFYWILTKRVKRTGAKTNENCARDFFFSRERSKFVTFEIGSFRVVNESKSISSIKLPRENATVVDQDNVANETDVFYKVNVHFLS